MKNVSGLGMVLMKVGVFVKCGGCNEDVFEKEVFGSDKPKYYRCSFCGFVGGLGDK